MPNLPYESEVSATTGNTQSQIRSAADPNAFGAGIGVAEQQLGDAGAGAANQVYAIGEKKAERQKKEQADNLLAQDDTAKLEADIQAKVPPNGVGYKDELLTARRNAIEDQAALIEDNDVRAQYRSKSYAALPELGARAGQWEVQANQAYNTLQANTSLNTVRNKVLADPYAYDTAVTQSADVIKNLANVPATLKPSMIQNQQQNLTRDRFDGMILRAKTPQDYDSISTELGSGDWQSKMNATEFQDTMNKVHAGKKALVTQVNTQAQAAVTALKTRSTDPMSLIPVEDLRNAATLTAQSTKPEIRTELARINRNQSLVQTYRSATPEQIQLQIDQNNKTGATVDGAVPADVAAIIDSATQFGVSADYLRSTRAKESSGDPSAKADGSSATGSMQFIDKTFLSLMHDPSVITALKPTLDELKIDPSAMTDAQILDLRTDDRVAIPAAAILAKQNQNFMERYLGREVSDTELYLAHFMGSTQATRFLKVMEAAPDANAATTFPQEAAANKALFGVGDDGAGSRTVAEVYQKLARSSVASPSSVIYGDNETLKKMKTEVEKNVNGPNGLAFAAQVGNINLPALNQPGAFVARGAALEAAQTKYGRLMKPFNADEEAYILKQVDEGDVNTVMGTMASIQSMGPKAATQAFEQLKIKNPAFSQAGFLALDGETAIAGDVIRGSKRIKENPEILKGADIKDTQLTTDYYATVGQALSRLPAQEASTQKAALAYLAENSLASGNKYKSSDYQAAVRAVLGNRVGAVHRNPVLLPKDTTGPQMEYVLQHLTLQDYVALSATGTAPVYRDGRAVDPKDANQELGLHAMGGDKYTMTDASGGFLMTRPGGKGPLQKYVAEMTQAQVQRLYNRNRQTQPYAAPAFQLNDLTEPDTIPQGPSRVGQEGTD